MVVRDGAHATAPLEVLMLRRSLRADFVGGAHVFPGGAVDPGDRDPTWGARCPGLPDAAASATLGLDEGGLAYWVAAVRECFEESGLLLARDASGDAISFSEHDVGDRFGRHRTALNARERSFLDVCEAEGLSLLVESLHYFAHWITPEGSPRRYDTRFFVAPAPAGQEPAHDAGETISDVWVRPADALDHHRSGDMELILPTIKNLQAIGRFATTAELLDAASAARDVPAVLPRVVADTGGVRLLLPGDAGYDVPGPGSEEAARRLSSDFDAATRLASRAANPAGGTEGAGDGRRRGGRGRGAGHG
jgi:8-oxo-dGTP pyrophosphatase MutT (NUDIX family)